MEVFCKKGVRNFGKFTWKHLCQRLFFNILADLNFIKKETPVQVFPCKFFEISKNNFFLRNTSGGCFWTFYWTKAYFWRCSAKQLFLKISQNSQVSRFNKVAFCEFCDIFKNTIFTEHLPTTASCWKYFCHANCLAEILFLNLTWGNCKHHTYYTFFVFFCKKTIFLLEPPFS